MADISSKDLKQMLIEDAAGLESGSEELKRQVDCISQLEELDKNQVEQTNKKKQFWLSVLGVLLPPVAMLIGYSINANRYRNAIVSDSYGVLQKSGAFKVIPNENPTKDFL